MDAQKLTEVVKEVNELKKEFFALQIGNIAGADPDLIALLQRVARHDDSVLADLAKLKEE
jgi:hypothetical protein